LVGKDDGVLEIYTVDTEDNCTLYGIYVSCQKPSQRFHFNLRSEIKELETKLNEERTRYGEMTKKGGNQAAYIPTFEHSNNQWVNLNPWALLASYRCQANVNRIELRVKIDEGTYGPLLVYICPKSHPKTVQIRSYEVKPLSSHTRVHSFDISRPLNTLSFHGNFSMAEAHSWLSLIVPGVPSARPLTDTVTVNYQSTSNAATQLQITYSKGSITFRSDSVSTIAIIRDIISEETTTRQIKVQMSCELNDGSVEHCLKLIHPRMTHLLNLEKKKMLASALKELEANSDDISFLSEKNMKILAEHDAIFQDAERDSLEESNILSLYETLLLSRARLNGHNARGKVDALRDLLLNRYNLEDVIAFFKSANDEASLRY
uniref:BBS2_C domain-containing protein n=1 Tax=Angiostrongylus cantonensis TaxID=6313 RepID=A0A158PCU7_ANGCA